MAGLPALTCNTPMCPSDSHTIAGSTHPARGIGGGAQKEKIWGNSRRIPGVRPSSTQFIGVRPLRGVARRIVGVRPLGARHTGVLSAFARAGARWMRWGGDPSYNYHLPAHVYTSSGGSNPRNPRTFGYTQFTRREYRSLTPRWTPHAPPPHPARPRKHERRQRIITLAARYLPDGHLQMGGPQELGGRVILPRTESTCKGLTPDPIRCYPYRQ